jgi:hypothetical protein
MSDQPKKIADVDVEDLLIDLKMIYDQSEYQGISNPAIAAVRVIRALQARVAELEKDKAELEANRTSRLGKRVYAKDLPWQTSDPMCVWMRHPELPFPARFYYVRRTDRIDHHGSELVAIVAGAPTLSFPQFDAAEAYEVVERNDGGK